MLFLKGSRKHWPAVSASSYADLVYSASARAKLSMVASCCSDIGRMDFSRSPREILVPRGAELPAWLLDPSQPEAGIPRTVLEAEAFEPQRARRALLAHFGVLTLQAFGCETLPQAVAAAGAALHYVRETQKRDLAHVTGLVTHSASDALVIDGLTRRNLELVENLADSSRRGTLLDVLDVTATPMGSRLLREWILRPLLHKEPIQDRLDSVEELAFLVVERGRFRDALAGVQDLDRIVGRVSLGSAGPRDLLALARSLRAVASARDLLGECLAPLVRRHLGFSHIGHS